MLEQRKRGTTLPLSDELRLTHICQSDKDQITFYDQLTQKTEEH